jgi:hypothetical protein
LDSQWLLALSLNVALFASENMRAETAYAAEQANNEDSWGSTPLQAARLQALFFSLYIFTT